MAMEEPKKPTNAYWIFLAENRAALTKEAGSASGPAVGKVAGAKWKSMTETLKAPYDKKAAEYKAAYEKAMEEFKAQGGVAGKRRQEKADKKAAGGNKRAKKDKDPNKPKKPQSAYWLFLAENRAAITKEVGTSMPAVAKKGGERWKVLDQKSKVPFEKKAAELRAEYDKAMTVYKASQPDADDDDDDEDGGEEEN